MGKQAGVAVWGYGEIPDLHCQLCALVCRDGICGWILQVGRNIFSIWKPNFCCQGAVRKIRIWLGPLWGLPISSSHPCHSSIPCGSRYWIKIYNIRTELSLSDNAQTYIKRFLKGLLDWAKTQDISKVCTSLSQIWHDCPLSGSAASASGLVWSWRSLNLILRPWVAR